MLKLLSTAMAAALLAMASTSFAQSTQYGTSAGSASGTVTIPDTGVPSVGGTAPSSRVGGLSKCENLLGTEKDKCLQDERGRTGSTSGRAAGAGGSHAPGSTGTGAGTMGPQNTAPSGSVR